MTDQEIIQLIEQREENRALLDIYKGFSMIEKSLLKIGASKVQAMDIFQEALYLFVQKVQKGNFVLTAKLSTYLYSVCRHIYLNEIKAEGKQKVADEEFIRIESDYDWEFENCNRLAEQAFKKLGEKCQQILIAYYYKQQNMKAIAKAFGFGSEKSARSQKYKCLEKAKSNYNQTQLISAL